VKKTFVVGQAALIKAPTAPYTWPWHSEQWSDGLQLETALSTGCSGPNETFEITYEKELQWLISRAFLRSEW